MRKQLVAGNWKMYKTPSEARTWFTALLEQLSVSSFTAEAALMVPFTTLGVAQEVLGSQVAYGAQDVSAYPEGAYTGEVSASMLTDLGCSYTVVGHSERRNYHQESNALVAAKAAKLLESNIIPILCVGEPLAVREQGQHTDYTLAQLEGSLVGLELKDPQQLVVAYEPVWAIGTGKTATPHDAEAMHQAIRGFLEKRFNPMFAQNMRVLYGGSVKPDNAAELFGQPNIDGGLVGGASLKLDSYLALVAAAK